MNIWAISFGIVTMAGATALFTYNLRRATGPTKPSLAGATGTFCLGLLIVCLAVMPDHPVSRVTQAVIAVIIIQLLLAELKLSRRQSSTEHSPDTHTLDS